MFVAIINYIWCESLEKGLMVVKIMQLQELTNGSVTMAELLISLLGGRSGFRFLESLSGLEPTQCPLKSGYSCILFLYIQEICGAIVKWFICLSYLFRRRFAALLPSHSSTQARVAYSAIPFDKVEKCAALVC
ncbi:hypothetical protein Droror1_Dr00009177 [Drosera rotundifolia]